MKMLARNALLALAVGATAMPAAVDALDFTPTDFEWSTWPSYCRARYVVSAAGRTSKRVAMQSPAAVQDWSQRLHGVWNGLHHYCAGLVRFERARSKSGKARAHEYQRAVTETEYTLDRSDQAHPLYSKMLVLRGRARFELGHLDAAFADFGRAIELHPEVADGYAAAGVLLRRVGQREEARDILSKGVDAISGNAELHYLLGLVLTELDDYAAAREHAELAYQHGYPLPGLKRKLQAAGHWE